MSEQSNKKVIAAAFARLRKVEQEVMLDGMQRLAEAGIEYLISAHNDHAALMHHTQEDDTLAWALARDGKILRSEAHHGGGDDIPGDATDKARAIAESTKGWAVIILSDMEGWYREDLEMDFLVSAANGIKNNFHSFFKKV